MLTGLLLLFLIQQSFAHKDLDLLKCLSAYPNIQLDCAKPFAQEYSPSDGSCQQLCIESANSARSCQYDSTRSLCELFDVKAKIGDAAGSSTSSQGSQSKTAHGISRTKIYATRKHRIQKLNCEPSPIPSIGYTLITVDSDCVSGVTATKTLADGRLLLGSVKKPVKIWKPKNMHYSGAKIASAISPVSGVSLANITGLNLNLTEFGSVQQKTEDSGSTEAESSKNSDCLPGFALRFEIIQGVEILANALVSFVADSSDICLHGCHTNHANGTSEPVSCRSAQYNRLERRCSFFDNSISPTGSAQYEPNRDMIYFEKICLPESLTQDCHGALRRVPQYVLVGHATAVVDAQTHSSCIELCLRSVEDHGFDCRSAIYFYEYPGLNCILNAQSARTRPNFFIAELEQKVDYVEMNDCQQTSDRTARKNMKQREGFIEMFDQNSRLNNEKLSIRELCNPLNTCCPLSLPNGSDDCEHGFRFQDNGIKVDCQPVCENRTSQL